MSQFRRVATPLGFLIFLWFKPISDLGFQVIKGRIVIDRDFPFISANLAIYLTVNLLVLILMIGLAAWGLSADYKIRNARQSIPRKDRDKLVLMVLLAASSIPSLFLLILLAKQFGLTGHEIFHLALPIIGTPVTLGWIWFRLRASDQTSTTIETIS